MQGAKRAGGSQGGLGGSTKLYREGKQAQGQAARKRGSTGPGGSQSAQGAAKPKPARTEEGRQQEKQADKRRERSRRAAVVEATAAKGSSGEKREVCKGGEKRQGGMTDDLSRGSLEAEGQKHRRKGGESSGGMGKANRRRQERSVEENKRPEAAETDGKPARPGRDHDRAVGRGTGKQQRTGGSCRRVSRRDEEQPQMGG